MESGESKYEKGRRTRPVGKVDKVRARNRSHIAINS